MFDHTKNLAVKIMIGLVFLFTSISIQPDVTQAQSTDESWSTPINLSKSGATSNPQFAIDSNGIFHVIWIDEIDGYVYTQSNNGEQWSTPIPISFPIQVDDSSPVLLSDFSGYIHAFWMNGENKLFYSLVLGSEFGNPNSWQGSISLAESALDFDVVIDSAGNLHLSYVRPLSSEQFPAGIYYRNSTDSGQTWSNALLIHDSKYYRSLTPENAHVQISSANLDGENHIYIAWDDRPINRIYLARSFDAGSNWDSKVIEEPNADSLGTTPFNVNVRPNKNQLLVIWQTGQPNSSTCNQFFKWSTDRGETWSNPQSMFDTLIGCATENKFLETSDSLTFLWTSIQDQIYLQAWDGSEWSAPQNQTNIDNFINTETMSMVAFRCRHAELTSGNHIFVIGCDASGGNDIWIINRSLGEISEWYPPPSAWNQPEIITTSGVDILSPIATSDNNNRLHILWSQPTDRQFPDIGTSIYYMRYSDENWSPPINIYITQQGMVDQISAATDNFDRIHVVWSGEIYGKILYSWANATRSTVRSEWTRPEALPSIQSLNSSPSIFIDPVGNMYVIYAQPINEERGIYLVKSEDGGASWSSPLLVFDAIGAGWVMVDQPKITRSTDGRLHALFKRLPVQGTRDLESLYYSQSNDDGLTWSDPEMITEGIIPYSQIYSTGLHTIHRVWQEVLEFGDIIQHDFSMNDGTNWQRSTTISNVGEIPSQIASVLAPSNQFFLLQYIVGSNGEQTLREFKWEDSDWNQGEKLQLKIQNVNQTNNLISSITPEGRIYGIVSQKELIPNSGTYNNFLWVTGHQIQTRIEIEITAQPEVMSPIQQTQTPSVITPTIIPENTIPPTPTVDLNPQEPNNGIVGFLNISWIGIIAGGVLVFIILIIVIIFSRRSLLG